MIILLVEDETDLAELTIEYLESEGIECDYASHGEQAIRLLQDHTYDAIVLDINLPYKNGFDVCESMRASGNTTPCVMLTARDSLDDRLEGFARGSDDYMIKPFAMEELVARLRALYKRSQPALATPVITIDDLVIDLPNKTAHRNGRALELSPIGWRLMTTLANASPAIVTRTTLEDQGWPNEHVSKDAFKMQLYRLRQQISHAEETPLLHTLRGTGFCLRGKTSS